MPSSPPNRPAFSDEQWSLLDRYLAGEDVVPPSRTESWHAIQQKLQAPPQEPQRTLSRAPVVPTPKRRPLFVWRGIAAVGTLAVAGFLLFQITTQPSAKEPSGASFNREHTTARGQRANIDLPDGSTVTLAPESRLRYAQDFGSNHRIVELDGTALFTVTHVTGHPFTVRAAGADTRVLGTRFSVRRYMDDGETRVLVTDGKVAVTAAHMSAQTVVTAGTEAIVSPTGTTAVRANVDTAGALAWIHGRLKFVDTPLRTVIADVARMYDIDLRLASPEVGEKPITAVIPESMRSADAVQLLAGIAALRVRQQGPLTILVE